MYINACAHIYMYVKTYPHAHTHKHTYAQTHAHIHTAICENSGGMHTYTTITWHRTAGKGFLCGKNGTLTYAVMDKAGDAQAGAAANEKVPCLWIQEFMHVLHAGMRIYMSGCLTGGAVI